MDGIEIVKSKVKLKSCNQIYLDEYIENGQIDEFEEHYFIPNETLMFFNVKDRQLFQLPDLYHGILYIEGKGILSKPDFRYKVRYYNYFNGAEYFLVQKGLFLYENDHLKFILSEHFYHLHQLVDQLNQKIEKGEDSLFTLSEIKHQFPPQNNIKYDQYLLNENVNVPTSFDIQLTKKENGKVDLQPQIKGVEDLSATFQEKFSKGRKVKNTYSMRDEAGNRERIYIKEDIKKGLEQILPYSKGEQSEDDLRKIFKHPQLYFDPSIFDLDRFSNRVQELGYYQPEYQGVVVKSGNDWIPGLIIEDLDGERTQILITSLEALEQFEYAIHEAEINHENSIEAQNKKIPLPNAKEAAEIAKDVLNYKPEPDDPELPPICKEKGVILIIKEEFEVEKTTSLKDFEYHEPPNLRPEINLYDYQKEGIAWMQSLSKSSKNIGGLLGDDMGLGKTLQVLSFIDWHQNYQKKINSNSPYLIVAPVTLLENWANEFDKFFDSTVNFKSFYGSESNTIDLEQLSNNDIILTTYETLRSKQVVLLEDEKINYKQSLSAVKWAGCFLDEAQRIKTPGTLITNAAKSLNADLRIAMTGTPVENSLVDLWCIMDFLMPGLLGGKSDFKSKYESNSDDEEEFVKLGEELRKATDFYLIRRMKSGNLKGLPHKNLYPNMKLDEGTVSIVNDDLSMLQPMPEVQKNKYLSFIKAVLTDTAAKQNKGLRMIWGIKLISDHPYILDQNISSILGKSSEELIQSSAKLLATIKLLNSVKEQNEKVIVFTELNKMQQLLKKVLEEKYSIPHISVINGQTSTRGEESRQKTVDKFQSVVGFNIIIMSPIAAGYGLNVTGANHVIHYTRHWNPAKEAQATDRVYRIGQTEDVHIYYPMSTLPNTESFDLKLAKLLGFKMMLSDSSMFPSTKLEVKESQLMSEDLSDLTSEVTKTKVTSHTLIEKDAISKKNILALLLQKHYHLSDLKVEKQMNKVQIFGQLPNQNTIGFALVGEEFNSSQNLEGLQKDLFHQEKAKKDNLQEIVIVFADEKQQHTINESVSYSDLMSLLEEHTIYEEDVYRLL